MLEIKGKTKVDYFHFQCAKCEESLSVKLGKDGAIPTITATYQKCGQSGTLKLDRTF